MRSGDVEEPGARMPATTASFRENPTVRFPASATAAAICTGVLLASPASAQMSEGVFWGHNNSYMSIIRNGDSVTIRYADPKSSLRRHGVRRGTVLFRGQMTGNRIRGTAYTFKQGCQPASYNVSGRYTEADYGVKTIVLRGVAPIREGCEVVGYIRNSSNARLEFGYAGTGD